VPSHDYEDVISGYQDRDIIRVRLSPSAAFIPSIWLISVKDKETDDGSLRYGRDPAIVTRRS
jgi:hypothetical protein